MATPKQVSYYTALRWQYPKAPGAWVDPDAFARNSVLSASVHIDKLTTYARHSWRWRVGSKQSVVAEHAWLMCLEHGWMEFSRSEFSRLEDRLAPFLQPEFGEPGLLFTRNVGPSQNGAPGGRVPKSRGEAITELRRVMSVIQKDVTRRLRSGEPPIVQDPLGQVLNPPPPDPPVDPEPPVDPPAVPDPPPFVPVPEPSLSPDWDVLYRRINQMRDFAETRELGSLFSMRVALDAYKAFRAGLPPAMILDSIMADWSEETRRQFLTYYDPPKIRELNGFARFGDAPDGVHAVGPYVEGLIRANIPVLLHGPAGTGKSSAAQLAAERLDLPYYELNLAGAMASAIRGRDTMTGFVASVFGQAYEHGGVLVLEEFDASHPNVATCINNAIANGSWANEATGTTIKRHPDFRIVATANTLGSGATKEFAGRMRLDGATLDRFRVGRVLVDHDAKLERHILGQMAGA